jgi:hypothetical protein
MLLDGDDSEAEIIHPLAMRGGEPAERELARAATQAAAAMLTDGQLNWSVEQGYYLVPVRRHIANVTVVEVFRLKYRPHTKATAAWYALMRQSTAEYLAHYQALGRDRTATNRPHDQRDAISRIYQGRYQGGYQGEIKVRTNTTLVSRHRHPGALTRLWMCSAFGAW